MNRLQKVITSQYRFHHKHPDDYMMIVMDETNIQEWYALVVGLDEPFIHGQYLFKFTIPKDFPMKPPRVEALTPNGVFELGGPFCISVGDFHKDKWMPSLGITGFARQVWNAMLFFDQDDARPHKTVRILHTSNVSKKTYAIESAMYNRTNWPLLMSKFDEYAKSYPDYLAVKKYVAKVS